jgi:hypothetical protein
VLAPHHAEHGELEVVGLASEDLGDPLGLVVGQAEGAVDGFGRRGHGAKLLGAGIRPFPRVIIEVILGFMPPAKKRTTTMSKEHKEALALGREQGRAVRRYLEALELHKPKRGRKRTAESVQRQLTAIESRLPDADPLTRVQLIQQRMDLQRELDTRGESVDLGALEAEFVRAARDYGKRKGISYAAWREAGVDAAVLKKAGIGRSS